MDNNQGYNPYKWVICPLSRVINLHITSYLPYPEPLSTDLPPLLGEPASQPLSLSGHLETSLLRLLSSASGFLSSSLTRRGDAGGWGFNEKEHPGPWQFGVNVTFLAGNLRAGNWEREVTWVQIHPRTNG